MANEYETAALAKARKDGLAATEVRALGYAAIAALAGVKLGPNGESPEDFFYRAVRAYVAGELEGEEAEAAIAAKEADLKAFMVLNPKFDGLDVYRDDEGNLVVK